MITEAQIQEVVQRIVDGYAPEQVILFGSYAHGNPTEDSDLDILVIKETEEIVVNRRISVLKLLRPIRKIAIDILVYTTQEIEKFKQNKQAFEYTALINSKILYQKNGY